MTDNSCGIVRKNWPSFPTLRGYFYTTGVPRPVEALVVLGAGPRSIFLETITGSSVLSGK